MLPTVRDSNALRASLHCAHNSPNTTLSWYRGSQEVITMNTRTIHDNGTLEFNPLIADADLTPGGVKYHCRLSNGFGSVISRTNPTRISQHCISRYITVTVVKSSCALVTRRSASVIKVGVNVHVSRH